jgi:flagella basal body P-ring formation protein FlgA
MTVRALRRAASLALLLFVSARGRAAAQEPAPGARLPVAARDLPRGAVLQSSDIAFRPAPAAPGAAARAEQPAVTVGWVTRRTMSAGEVLHPPAVSPPLLVNAGDEVEAVWREGSIELRLHGRAMNAATEGGRVAVRVDMTRRFEGVAVGAGLVRLDSPSRSR